MIPRSPIPETPHPLARLLAAALGAALLIGVVGGCTTAETAPPLQGATPPSDEAPAAQSIPGPPSANTEQDDAPALENPEVAEVPNVVAGEVARTVDGDTAHILIDGVREKVRFIGIDTPESTREVEPYGKAAAAYTAGKLPIGGEVWLETDAELRDRYGRLLAYIWLAKPTSRSDAEIRAKMLNAQIAIDGYAQQMTFPPNVRYVEHFRSYVQEAREAQRGLWVGEDEQSSATDDPDTAAAAAPSASADAVVFITRTGEKYHLDGCSSLRRSRIAVTLGDAKQRGYEPCKLCRPPQ